MEIQRALKTSIIIAGGTFLVEILGPAKLELPPLPEVAYKREFFPTLIFTNIHQLMFFTWKKCWVLKKCKNKVNWAYHSELKHTRKAGLVLKMSKGIYVFGGQNLLGTHTSEFLPNGTKKWIDGPKLPNEVFGKLSKKGGFGTKVFGSTCALAISSNELLMAGVHDYSDLIMKLNVDTQEWTDIGTLEGKVNTMCIFNDKVVIVYGDAKTAILPMRRSKTQTNQLKAHLEHPVVFKRGGDLNSKKRVCQKMGIVSLRGTQKLVIFGTTSHFEHEWDQKMPVEEWNDELEQWEISTELEFPSCRRGFAVCFDSI